MITSAIECKPVYEGRQFFGRFLLVDTRNRRNYAAPLDCQAGWIMVIHTGLESWRGSEKALTEIKLKKGESVEKALRRLKKRIDREGTLKEVRNHRHFEKPSEKRRRKMKVARFSAMLSARYADL